MSALLETAGFLVCLLAAALLRLGWLGRGHGRLGSLLAGGGMVVAAIAPFMLALGPAAGLAAALPIAGLAGFMVTVQGREWRPYRVLPARRIVAPSERGPARRRRGWARGVAAFLLTLLTAEAVCAGVAAVLPGTTATRFAALVALAPLLWASLIAWALGDPRFWRPLTGMTGMIGASLLLVAAGLAT